MTKRPVKQSLTTATVKESLTVQNLSTFELTRMVERFPLIGERRMADILIHFIKMRQRDAAIRPTSPDPAP